MGTSYSDRAPQHYHLDIRKQAEVDECLDSFKPTVVFLCVISPGGVEACEKFPHWTFFLEVQGTANVAVATVRHRAKLIYFSTDYVFDGRCGPYSEQAMPNPINAYGRHKWQAEDIALGCSEKSLVIRTTAVFGWSRTSSNIVMQVYEALSIGQRFSAPSNQWCNPTFVDFLAEASVEVALKGESGILNIVGNDRSDRASFAEMLALAMGFDYKLIGSVETDRLGQSAKRPLQGGLTTEKLEGLGIKPPDLEESLRLFRESYEAALCQKP